MVPINIAVASTLTKGQVEVMTDAEVEAAFAAIRWSGGRPQCPRCTSGHHYRCRTRTDGGPRFRCANCGKDYTLTSGSVFHSRKWSLRQYLIFLAAVLNERQGVSAYALCQEFGWEYKTVFPLFNKLRAALMTEPA